MTIRRKLLILLLAIALIPLLFNSWFDQRVTRRAGQELGQLNRQILMEGASRNLIMMVRDYATIIRRERELLELLLHIQGEAAERALAQADPAPAPVYFDQNFDLRRNLPQGMIFSTEHFNRQTDKVMIPLEVSYLAQSFRLPPGQDIKPLARDVARLSALLPTYRFLERKHPSLIYWQRTSLENGLQSAYPAHGGYPPGYDPREKEWYTRARESGSLVWTPPRMDDFSSQMVLTVSRPVERPGGNIAGVTSIDVPLPALLQSTKLKTEWAASMRSLIVDLSFYPDSDALGLRIIADYSARTALTPWNRPEGMEWLEGSDKWRQEAMIKEMIAGRSGVVQMAFQGRESLWAYGPVDGGRTYLVYIMPHDEIVSEAEAGERYVLDRTNEQLRATGLTLLVVVIIVVILAVIGSRTVTRPIKDLLAAARRISEGDLEARTEILTRDELQELGRSFNDMVPKLQDQMQLRQSLNLAMEVQQNLLPGAPPVIEGFQLAGRSIYSDQTGGDYYDFLVLGENGRSDLGVAIGDVTGHGIAAALLMTTARAMVRTLACGPGGMAEMMAVVNQRLTDDTYAGRFMTLFYLVIDVESRSIHWVASGHDPAVVYDPVKDEFDELGGSDIPLGINADWKFREFSRGGWSPGQTIVLGTDGIWESRNPEGQMFGKEALNRIIRKNADRSAEELIEAIIQALTDFRQDRSQADDVTVVVIKVEEDGASA